MISALSGGRPTVRRPASPVLAETASLPTRDRVGSDEHEGLPPLGPDSRQPDPDQAIRRAQSGLADHSLVHGDLVTQGEVLEGEVAAAAAEEEAGGAGG